MDEADRIKEAYRKRARSVGPDRYALSRPSNRFALQERQMVLMAALERRELDLGRLRLLEVGCGAGTELAWLVELGARPLHLVGIDLREDAVIAARNRVPGATIDVGDARRLPYPPAAFDVVYQSTALSSMPSSTMRTQVAHEMLRVVKPGGLIVSYDFASNPRNRDTRGVSKADLRRLFPSIPIEEHRLTLAPPLARWLGDRSPFLMRLVWAIPWLRTHRLSFLDLPG